MDAGLVQHGFILQCRQRGGDLCASDGGQAFHHIELVIRHGFVFVFHGIQHGGGELVRGRSRCDHAWCIVTRFRHILFVHIDGDPGMGIAQVVVFFEVFADGFFGCGIIAEPAVKFALQFRQNGAADAVLSILPELIHQGADGSSIVIVQVIEQPFQVGGDQDIHGRAGGGIECPVPVVSAGADEVRQNVVLVGRADEFLDGYAHFLCIDGGKDVAEVSGRDRHIEAFALLQCAVFQQVAVRGNVIHHLRHETPEVDGVGGGEFHICAGEKFLHAFIGKDIFYAGLGIVKVAVDGADCHIVSGLGGHLQFLHRADSFLGEEDNDLGLFHVCEAVEGGFSGIAGGRHKDDHGLFRGGLAGGSGQQIGQQLESHIFERAGGTVPQFQQVHPRLDFHQRSGIFILKSAGIGTVDAVEDLGFREVGQIQGKDCGGAFLIGHSDQFLKHFIGDRGEGFRHEKAAFFGDALCNDSGGIESHGASGTGKFHGLKIFLLSAVQVFNPAYNLHRGTAFFKCLFRFQLLDPLPALPQGIQFRDFDGVVMIREGGLIGEPVDLAVLLKHGGTEVHIHPFAVGGGGTALRQEEQKVERFIFRI